MGVSCRARGSGGHPPALRATSLKGGVKTLNPLHRQALSGEPLGVVPLVGDDGLGRVAVAQRLGLRDVAPLAGRAQQPARVAPGVAGGAALRRPTPGCRRFVRGRTAGRGAGVRASPLARRIWRSGAGSSRRTPPWSARASAGLNLTTTSGPPLGQRERAPSPRRQERGRARLIWPPPSRTTCRQPTPPRRAGRRRRGLALLLVLRAGLPLDEAEAGTHTAVFDGGALPSGAYVVRLRTGAAAPSRRVTLLR